MTQSLFWSNSSEYESGIRSQYNGLFFSNRSTCVPYWQVPVGVYRDGHSLYGNWPTYIFAASANVNVSLFLSYTTLLFLCRLCTGDCQVVVVQVARKAKSGGIVINKSNPLWCRVCLHTAQNVHNTSLQFSQKNSGPPKFIPLTRDKLQRMITTAQVREQVKDCDTSVYKNIINKLSKDMPGNRGYHSICFDAFTLIPKNPAKLYERNRSK